MARYGLFVLKVPLNPNQPTNLPTYHTATSAPNVVVETKVANVCVVGRAKDRANALFKQVHVSKSLKGRSNDAIGSACLYIACRQETVPRTFKGLL